MKSAIFLLTFFVIILSNWSMATPSPPPGVTLRKTNIIKEFLARKLSNVWNWMLNQNEDTVVGRCLGIARKLKFFMPLMVFKLGVIITTLGFLTIFSLKGLAMLGFLVLMNVSGFAAKIALLLKGGGHDQTTPNKAQNIHFHIHQNKNGHFSVEPSGYGHEYYDRSDESATENFYDQMKRLNGKYDPYYYRRR